MADHPWLGINAADPHSQRRRQPGPEVLCPLELPISWMKTISAITDPHQDSTENNHQTTDFAYSHYAVNGAWRGPVSIS